MATGQCLKTITADADDEIKQAGVSFVSFSPNGNYILVSKLDGSITLCNYAAGACLRRYTGHQNTRYCIFSGFTLSNGKYIVSGSEDNCIYVWDLQTRDIVQKIAGHEGNILFYFILFFELAMMTIKTIHKMP